MNFCSAPAPDDFDSYNGPAARLCEEAHWSDLTAIVMDAHLPDFTTMSHEPLFNGMVMLISGEP